MLRLFSRTGDNNNTPSRHEQDGADSAISIRSLLRYCLGSNMFTRPGAAQAVPDAYVMLGKRTGKAEIPRRESHKGVLR
jgi:hypothetical protein